MSHFCALVLVDSQDPATIRSEVDRLLAPYDESIEVAPYQTECYCVGMEARKEIDKKVADRFGDWGTIRKEFRKQNEKLHEQLSKLIDQIQDDESCRDELDRLTNERDAAWKEFIKPINEYEQDLKEKHIGIKSAVADCEDCNGTGSRLTTYNPNSKWDWYDIGGRWDGCISGEARESEDGGFNFGEHYRQLEHNMRTVESMLEDEKPFIPFAIVTLDGVWNKSADMGWWACTSNEDDNWDEKAVDLLKANKNCVAVAVDLHI
jgi:hypothetical protein